MPVRLEGRPAVSVPVSPWKTSSESRWRYHKLSEDCRFGMTSVRTPNSMPFARTSGVTRSIDRLAGTRIDVRRRAASVVAVEALTEIHEILGLLPRAQDDRELRRADRSAPAP